VKEHAMKKLCLCLVTLFMPAALRAEDKVDIQVVKFDVLEKAIAAAKGKVVVVDFWATFCIPCKKEFPNLVQLHKQYGPEKIACMSVTVDDQEDKDKALRFLRQQKAAFANFLLDEPAEAYQKRYKFGAVPCIKVYGVDGKLVESFTADEKEFSYKDVRPLVERLMK
jgi:thiol-disulfide isomerase/thioredoxin